MSAIYVELPIRAPLERLWEEATEPDRHAAWDLRFSEIDDTNQPTTAKGRQLFRYRTRLGFGLDIAGMGETRATRTTVSGRRTSVLRFWSFDAKSLIREGIGYWKFLPEGETVRFVTGYDYKTRFGLVGRWFDQLLFRPLMGWATAWSFDRLRLRLEKGIPTAVSLRLFLVYMMARCSLAAIWWYHGLFPKWIFPEHGEFEIWQKAFGPDVSLSSLQGFGLLEMLLGSMFLTNPFARLAAWVTLLGMPVATVALGFISPDVFALPFPPITYNLSLACLAGSLLLTADQVPLASRCHRKRRRSP